MSSLTLTPVVPGQIGEIVQVIEEVATTTLAELQYGFFADYGCGVHGLDIEKTDPPSQHWIDNVHRTGTATIRYDNTASGMAPLPMMARISAPAGGNSYFEWSDRTFPILPEHFGSLYVYLHSAPSSGPIIAQWSKNLPSGRAGCLTIASATRKLQIQNTAPTTVATSTTAFAVGQLYRLEWHIVHGGAGTVAVKIFEGHATTEVETLSASFDLGDAADNFTWGNVNSASGVDISVGGIAENCVDWVGPYTEPRGIHSFDGVIPFDYLSEGVVRFKAHQTKGIDLSQHPNIQADDTVVELGPGGVSIGLNRKLGNPLSHTNQSFMDTFFPSDTARINADSISVTQLSDPPDITLMRYEVNPGSSVDTDATIVSGNPEVTFANYTFTLVDRGRAIVVNGVAGNILEVTGSHTCTITPTPTSTGSGLSRSIYFYPYPEALHGCNNTLPIGQVRWTPATWQSVRWTTATTASGVNALNSATVNVASTSGFPASGSFAMGGVVTTYTGLGTAPARFTGCGNHAATTGGEAILDAAEVVSTNSTVTITGTEFTQADVDRAVLINNDPTLAAAAPQGDCFIVVSVVDGVSATLDAVVPATLPNVRYAVSTSATDANADPENDSATNPGFNNATLTGKMSGSARNWGNGWTAPIDWRFNQADNALYTGAAPNDADTLVLYHDGKVLAGRGALGYDTAAGSSVIQGSGSGKATGVTISTPCGKITMNNASLAAGATVGFTVTNSLVAAPDTIRVNMGSVGTTGAYRVEVDAVAAGSFHISVQNVSAGPLGQAIVLNFTLLKGDS